MDKAWKVRERIIAKDFGAERNALSGGNSKLSRSDSTHPELFIEAKGRKNHRAIGLYDNTKVLARKENKVPVVCLWQPARHGYLVLCDPKDLRKLAELYEGEDRWQEEQAGTSTQQVSEVIGQ